MTVFKGKNWIKGIYGKSKTVLKRIQLQDLTGRIQEKHPIRASITWLNTYKIHGLKAVGVLGLLTSISLSGNYYVKTNTFEVYHVYVGSQESGVVSDKSVVAELIEDKYAQLAKEYPGVNMELNDDDVRYETERAFKAESDNSAALKQLDHLLQSQAYGVQMKVDDKVVATVKDEETARDILDKIKGEYMNPEEKDGKVSILSANSANPSDAPKGLISLESIDFVQEVELGVADIQPEDIMEPQDVLHKLQTGNVQPTKYVVQAGDCVSCIAEKFGIKEEMIYDNNPWIVDDMIHIGDQMDLTVLQPTISVKTVEKFVEDQEMQYDTIYHKDPELRAGKTRVITPGKNGLKKVTFHLIKVNGHITDEQLIDEKVMLAPVSAVVKKGTKIVLGEGTGKFSWPVIGARLTSSFGIRWGAMHKGIDLASSNRSILAADNGKVIFSGTKNGYGNVVILDHKNGYQTLYAHMSKVLVSKGKTVEKGEKIGIMGSTGESTGVHLHFEVHKSGSLDNPLKYLSK